MNNFKFLAGNPTTDELLKYAWTLAREVNSTPKGVLLEKSWFKTFVLGPICNDTNISTYEDVERLVKETAIDPDTIPDGQVRLHSEEQYYLDILEEEDNIYEETIHNELGIPHLLPEREDTWEEMQNIDTERNELDSDFDTTH